MKKVLVFGTFDLLHQGHIDFLKQASGLGNELTVVVARDENVHLIKNRWPKWIEQVRLDKVRELKIVDKALLGNKHLTYDLVTEINPEVIGIGYDQAVDMDKLKQIYKGEVVRLRPFKEEIYKSSKLK